MAGGLLVTGAGGYLGARLAAAWLADGGGQATLWLHARDRAELEAKSAPLRRRLGAFGGAVRFAGGDLWAARPFDDVDPAAIGVIVHAAAATRFNVDEATASAVNVEGTRKLLTLAARCPRLEDVTLLSSVYASGLRAGVVAEAPLDGQAGFANHYERSKWGAERVLLDEFPHLPWRVARVATVIADDDTGQVGQQNAVHSTLKLLYHGLLPVTPGRADTPLYFVTGEFVTSALTELLRHRRCPAVVHLAHTEEESARLGDFLDTAFGAFEAEPAFRRRRVLRPLLADAEAFALLAGEVATFGGAVVTQALASVVPFAAQLGVAKAVENRRLRGALAASYRAPDPRALIERTCRFLVESRWGRGPIAAGAPGATDAR